MLSLSKFSRPPSARTPVPRGIARSGPAILSYGFRPFFLLAGTYGAVAMIMWVGTLSGLWSIGGREGPIAWHAHEMLFGYAVAALAGFVLTAVPNWTGRLPVSGQPLAVLVAIWLAGRTVSIWPYMLGEGPSAVIDALFLPALAFVVAREVIVGRNWQNLRVAGAISTLALLHMAFHAVVLTGNEADWVLRGTVALYVLLVCQIGGKIIPSFTRNYLARSGATNLPAPAGRFDQIVIAATLIAGMLWTASPEGPLTASVSGLAAVLNSIRLARWHGGATWREPLVTVLHVAYGFVPIGYFAVSLAAIDLISQASALHVLTVGVIGLTTLAVMTRATRGHTGRALTASYRTTAAYALLLAVAVLRPLAETVPDLYSTILMASGLSWIAAFALFVQEHMIMLIGPSLVRGRGSN